MEGRRGIQEEIVERWQGKTASCMTQTSGKGNEVEQLTYERCIVKKEVRYIFELKETGQLFSLQFFWVSKELSQGPL